METWRSTFQEIRPVIHLGVATFIFFSAFIMVVPFMVDVMLGAICSGQIQCSQVILMMSAQQVIIGVCATIAGPCLGSLSDNYGRKPIILVVHLAGIVPTAILAYSRDEAAVYRWWVAWIVASTIRESSLHATVFSYVADAVGESHRVAAIGLTAASPALGFIMGTVAVYFINTAAQAYLIATIIQIVSAIYVTIFVAESYSRLPLLPVDKAESETTTKLLKKPQFKRQTTNLRQTARTLWNTPLLRTIALVNFMCVFGTSGLVNFTVYYLRAAFIFDKDQLATVSLVSSLSTAVGQMLVYPGLSYAFGQRAVVWISLVGSIAHYIFFSFAWSPWLPFIAVSLGVFSSFIDPAVATISSRGVDQEMRGKLQGVLSAVRSVGGIVAPLVLTPLTAAALGDSPLLDMRGLPYLVCGGVTVLALGVSLWLPYIPISEELDKPCEYMQAPLPPEDFIHVPTPPEEFLHMPLHPETVRGVDCEDSNQCEKIRAQSQCDSGQTEC
ncbi:unnamed protein product [Calypogeia fissa]